MHGERPSSWSKFLVSLTGLISILAWITYGSLTGVLGTISYLLVGLLGLFPWILPFVGIPLGLLDLLDIFGVGMYSWTLDVARLDASWLTGLWYALVVVIGVIGSLLLSVWMARAITKKEPQPRDLALVNCHILDGSREGAVIHDGVILVKNVVDASETPGRIAAVGPASQVDIPERYDKIDLDGQYVLPGFINAHCHLFGSGQPMKLFQFMSENEGLMRRLIGWLSSRIGRRLVLRMMTANARNALHSGVTTVRAMGDLGYLDVKLRKMIEKRDIIGPRLLVSGPGICPTGGHGGYMGYVADSPDEIKRMVRANLREEVDWIKILSTGGVMDARQVGEAGQPQMMVDEIEIACTTAHRGGVMVATHCESTQGIEEALLGGVDTIEHGASITDELAPLFKQNPKALKGYTALVPTLSAGMGLSVLPPDTTQISQMSFENAGIIEREMIRGLKRAYEEELPLAVGTDAAVPYVPHYEFWKELKYYLHYTDMTPQEAIYYATKNNAQILGIGDETGSIEPGKAADLQVVAGNPLEDIHHLGQVTKVVVRGVLIEEPKVKRIKALDENPLTELLPLSEDRG
jgi:imidazolonepropionase-like amidohydrolase